PEISSATQAQLERLGFRVLTDTRIVCADRDGFYRDDGQLIPGDLLVWAAGVKAPSTREPLSTSVSFRRSRICGSP
ncbi:FAD-dependent oxidoreductase, partial [Klebsiella pneumoniae]